MAGHLPRGRPLASPAACSPHRACRSRGQCWAPTPKHPRPQHVGGGPQQPAPVGGQSGEGQRLASDAPHSDGRHPPGDALPPPPQQAMPARRGARCEASAGSPRPHRPHPGHRVAEPWLPTPEGGRPGEGQRLTPGAPHNGGRHPPGDAFPPPPQQATPASKGARCGTGAGSPRPHRPHPGHTGRGTLAARSTGRAAGGGTAPDTRRPSQQWQPTPPGTAPHHPRGTQPPQGMQARGTVLGPHTHTPAPTARGWQTPTTRPIGGQSGEGQRLTSDAPHTMVEGAPPRGRPTATPTASNAGPQGCTLWGRCGSSRPRQPHPGHTGRGTPATRSRGRAAGGGTAPNTRRPSQ